jgi:hypothetical protein
VELGEVEEGDQVGVSPSGCGFGWLWGEWRDALVPKPPKPEATSTAEKGEKSSGNGGESAKKQDTNASSKDDMPATTETAVSTDQALKSESPESQGGSGDFQRQA